MKAKLFVLAMLVCSISLIAGCKNEQHKGKSSDKIVLPQDIRNIITQKYPDATILDFDKEQNGSEVKIKDKGIQKEVWFGTNGEWISTEWDTRTEDVPVAIMAALLNSAYQQYKIKDIDAIEKTNGMFYVFELKLDNNEVKITFNADAQIVQ